MKIIAEEGPGNHTTLHFVGDTPKENSAISAPAATLLSALRYGLESVSCGPMDFVPFSSTPSVEIVSLQATKVAHAEQAGVLLITIDAQKSKGLPRQNDPMIARDMTEARVLSYGPESDVIDVCEVVCNDAARMLAAVQEHIDLNIPIAVVKRGYLSDAPSV